MLQMLVADGDGHFSNSSESLIAMRFFVTLCCISSLYDNRILILYCPIPPIRLVVSDLLIGQLDKTSLHMVTTEFV